MGREWKWVEMGQAGVGWGGAGRCVWWGSVVMGGGVLCSVVLFVMCCDVWGCVGLCGDVMCRAVWGCVGIYGDAWSCVAWCGVRCGVLRCVVWCDDVG